MNALAPYILPGLMGLLGIVLGAYLTRWLNRDDIRAKTLSDINTQMTQMSGTAIENAQKNLELQNVILVTMEDHKKLKLKNDRLEEDNTRIKLQAEKDVAEIKSELEALKKRIEKFEHVLSAERNSGMAAHMEMNAYRQQLINAGITPRFASFTGGGSEKTIE